MTKSIICAGFGGQGIMFMGKLLGYAAMKLGYKITWISSYGAEARGGAAHCMLVISDEDIPSPIIEEPDICVAMNSPSFEKFKNSLKKRGLMILNSSLIRNGKPMRKDIRAMKIPMTDIAGSMGNIKVANMVALGAMLLGDKLFDIDVLSGALEDFIPAHRKNLLDINKRALIEGYEFSTRNKG